MSADSGLLRLRESGKLRIAWRRGDLLITHAGVDAGWFETAASAQARLASQWSRDPRADIFSSANGVLWHRGRTEQRFRQIIGHTPRPDGPHWEGTTLNIDIGGKHFHQLAGVWIEKDGSVGEVVRYENAWRDPASLIAHADLFRAAGSHPGSDA
jgi:hypothetical protein